MVGVFADDACIPLCYYDAERTAECHVSRQYAGALITAYAQGPWGSIVTTHVGCEANLTACPYNPDCEIDGAGRCAAKRSWVVEKLAAGESQDGAALNSDRCGIFGRMLARGAECLLRKDQAECETADTVPCAWDDLRGVCDASRQELLFILRRDYRDELARVSLRRERCLALGRRACTGDCFLVNGTCTLRKLDAILAVMGEDCPLTTLLRQNAGCWSLRDQPSCTSRTRPDGMRVCDWRREQCEAHPMALEFDLLLVLGLGQPAILSHMQAAQSKCSEFVTSQDCGEPCAPIVDRGIAEPRRLLSTMVLLLSAAISLLA